MTPGSRAALIVPDVMFVATVVSVNADAESPTVSAMRLSVADVPDWK